MRMHQPSPVHSPRPLPPGAERRIWRGGDWLTLLRWPRNSPWTLVAAMPRQDTVGPLQPAAAGLRAAFHGAIGQSSSRDVVMHATLHLLGPGCPRTMATMATMGTKRRIYRSTRRRTTRANRQPRSERVRKVMVAWFARAAAPMAWRVEGAYSQELCETAWSEANCPATLLAKRRQAFG